VIRITRSIIFDSNQLQYDVNLDVKFNDYDNQMMNYIVAMIPVIVFVRYYSHKS